MAADTPDPDGILARRLTHLFETVHPGRDKPFSYYQVADAINEAAGEQAISGVYLWKLATGRRDNPTYKHLIALAQFFGVPPAYFFPEHAAEPLPREVTAALSDDRLRDLVLRQAGLSEQSLETISQMVDSARAFDQAHSPRRGRRPASKDGGSPRGGGEQR
jgi:transcriptional regulator with XRE-family HTH domain